jgi:type II secretory pathway component PulF
MPVYIYKAKDQSGTTVKGEAEATSQLHLFRRLSDTGHFVCSIKEKEQGFLKKMAEWGQKVKTVDLIIFTRQLSTLLDAGIPINTSLGIISGQIENKKLAQAVQQIRSDIEAGLSLGDALKKFPRVFDTTYIAMIEAGEAGGMLSEALDRLATLAEVMHDRKTKVKSALTYPVILLVAAFLGIAFLVTVVFPLFAKIFSRANVPLPLPTAILIKISQIATNYWWAIFLGVFILSAAFGYYIKTEIGRWNLDNFKLKIPIFGKLFRKAAISYFAHAFKALNKSGIPLSNSLDIVSKVVGNKVISKAIEDARTKVSEGQGIANSLKETGEIPDLPVHMISVGEESGRLDDMLEKISQYYDRDVDYTIGKLTESIQPILMVVMGLVVAFMYMSLILPMLQMLKVIRAGGLG